jgi:hypothetical protein
MRRFLPIAAAAAIIAGAALTASVASGTPALVHSKTFSLTANPAFVSCTEKNPGVVPTAKATVTRGGQNDTLSLKLNGFKPGLGFDLFTVQNSNLLANGTPNPSFTNFGLAWYQSDVSVNSEGTASVTLKTILLDQIFGFDPAASLAPTNTFHLGFWFDSVAEAQPCSGTTLTPTPFNGEHNAGPVAFISTPSAKTGLGPLCTQPFSSGGGFACHP